MEKTSRIPDSLEPESSVGLFLRALEKKISEKVLTPLDMGVSRMDMDIVADLNRLESAAKTIEELHNKYAANTPVL